LVVPKIMQGLEMRMLKRKYRKLVVELASPVTSPVVYILKSRSLGWGTIIDTRAIRWR
jgi:hypothetical protein